MMTEIEDKEKDYMFVFLIVIAISVSKQIFFKICLNLKLEGASDRPLI